MFSFSSIRNQPSRLETELSAAGWLEAPDAACRLLFSENGAATEGYLRLFQRGSERLAVLSLPTLPREMNSDSLHASLYERFLDVTPFERSILWGAAPHVQADWLLLGDTNGCSLFDAIEEVAVNRCPIDAPEERATALLAILAESNPDRRPRPDRERLAEDLTRWFELFVGSLGPALKWARADVERLGWQLLLGLKILLSERGEAHGENLRALGLGVERTAETLSLRPEPVSASALVDLLLRQTEEFLPDGAGSFSSLERLALVRQIESLSPARQATLSEILLLCAAKRRALVQLRALAPAEQEQVAWRLALLEPLRVEEEIESLDLYVYQPLVLDLAACGYGRIFEALEKLADFALRQARRVREAGGRQIDFVEPEPEGLDEANVLVDPFNWLLRHALRLKVAPGCRERVAYLLASYILDLKQRESFAECRLSPLTSLPAVFAPVRE